MNLILVAIDPGQTTGWAVLQMTEEGALIIDKGVVADYSVGDMIPAYLSSPIYPPAAVVIEQPPRQGNDPKLLELHGKLTQLAEEHNLKVYQIMPGLWKPYMRQIGFKKVETDHERRHINDAYAMGLYVARLKFKVKEQQ